MSEDMRELCLSPVVGEFNIQWFSEVVSLKLKVQSQTHLLIIDL